MTLKIQPKTSQDFKRIMYRFSYNGSTYVISMRVWIRGENKWGQMVELKMGTERILVCDTGYRKSQLIP